MTTNILESMNAALVKVMELPITAFVNEIHLLCQKWFYECHNKAKYCTTKMSMDVEKKKLKTRRDQAKLMDVSCTYIFLKLFMFFFLKNHENIK